MHFGRKEGGGTGRHRVAFARNVVKLMRDTALRLFHTTFHARPSAAASAPGRVNLIGEHTDYNGGPVLPVAIAARTVVAVGPAEPGVLELVSALDGTPLRLPLRESRPEGWSAYVAGVLAELGAQGAALSGGVRVAVASDVPVGAGLASSAALTVATAKAVAG